MDRRQWLLAALRREMRLIEIGPSHSPLLPKKQGWNTTVVDHTTREGLLEKYASHEIDLSQIEEVDIVWSRQKLHDNFPSNLHGTFDGVLASHVLEHMPDPVSFLQSCGILLAGTGRIVLANPDKRCCFDYFGPWTTTGDFVAAHANRARLHSPTTAFNHVAYAVTKDDALAWALGSPGTLKFAHRLADALTNLQNAADDRAGNYADYHAWRFTPASFQLLILELGSLGLIDFRIEDVSPTFGHEFYATLVRGRETFGSEAELNARRMLLLQQIRIDLQHQ